MRASPNRSVLALAAGLSLALACSGAAYRNILVTDRGNELADGCEDEQPKECVALAQHIREGHWDHTKPTREAGAGMVDATKKWCDKGVPAACGQAAFGYALMDNEAEREHYQEKQAQACVVCALRTDVNDLDNKDVCSDFKTYCPKQ